MIAHRLRRTGTTGKMKLPTGVCMAMIRNAVATNGWQINQGDNKVRRPLKAPTIMTNVNGTFTTLVTRTPMIQGI